MADMMHMHHIRSLATSKKNEIFNLYKKVYSK